MLYGRVTGLTGYSGDDRLRSPSSEVTCPFVPSAPSIYLETEGKLALCIGDQFKECDYNVPGNR